jgi:hypothetical protein
MEIVSKNPKNGFVGYSFLSYYERKYARAYIAGDMTTQEYFTARMMLRRYF